MNGQFLITSNRKFIVILIAFALMVRSANWWFNCNPLTIDWYRLKSSSHTLVLNLITKCFKSGGGETIGNGRFTTSSRTFKWLWFGNHVKICWNWSPKSQSPMSTFPTFTNGLSKCLICIGGVPSNCIVIRVSAQYLLMCWCTKSYRSLIDWP